MLKLKKNNFDYPILELENPSGTIDDGGFAVLQFRFQPLETKLYEVEIPISIVGGVTYFVTFVGEGHEPKLLDPSFNRTATVLPHTPSVPKAIKDVNVSLPSVPPNFSLLTDLPEQMLKLSLEEVDFETVPCLSIHRKLIIVTNSSTKESIVFTWQCSLPQDGHKMSSILDVEPSQGFIESGKFAVCNVLFSAGPTQQI